MRVGAERVKAELIGLCRAAVQNETGVDALRTDRQLRRGPPADIALGVGPDDVEARRLNLLGRATHLVQCIGAVGLVEAVQHRVGGRQKRPPHRDWRLAGVLAHHIIDDRAVRRFQQRQCDRGLALDGDLLLGAFHVRPLPVVPDLIRVIRVGLLGNKVHVIVLEHGQAPAEIHVVAQQRERVECRKVPVQLEARRRQLRFVPYRRHREAYVRVTRQDRLAALRAAAGNHPGVAAFELRQTSVFKRLVTQLRQLIQALPVGVGQCRFRVEHAVRVPVQVEDFQVLRPKLIAHIGQQRLGSERRGKTVSQIAGDADRILCGEAPSGNAQCVELHRPCVGVLILVDAIDVGFQRFPGRGVLVLACDIRVRVFANAQGAKQFVGLDQIRPEYLRQLATCQATQHFHLEQPVLSMGIAQRTVKVGFVLGADVRHATLVVAQGDGGLKTAHGDLAVAYRQLAIYVPARATCKQGDDDG